MPSDDHKIIIKADKTPLHDHRGRFNAPTLNEVAILISEAECDTRDIVLKKRSNQLVRISETHRSYDALQYPIILWDGEDSYHFNIPLINPSSGDVTTKKVSAMQFYAHRIMIRDIYDNHLLRCKQLFNQFIVDMYAKIESERLNYIRANQKDLRVDEYTSLRDAINTDCNPNDIGKKVILPATFTGSPRHMHEYAQDAMLYVQNYGRPDLFITFTCNPNWAEVSDNLLPGQSASDRHDILARVFRQKLIRLINLITKSNIFGPVQCHMYSVEWQKRGLPHAHILIWLRNKIVPDQVDMLISAEIPNIEDDQILHDIVSRNMIHGPCGAINPSSPCMKNGQCSKHYPKHLLADTITGKH